MSKESAIKFLRELRTNEKAKELLQGRKKPKSKEDVIKAYVEIATALGEDISAEDIAQALEEIEAEIHQKTEAVSADMVELEDDDLEGVAGGFYTYVNWVQVYDKCVYDFKDTSCASEDACTIFDVYYYDCSGEFYAAGAEQSCWVEES